MDDERRSQVILKEVRGQYRTLGEAFDTFKSVPVDIRTLKSDVAELKADITELKAQAHTH